MAGLEEPQKAVEALFFLCKPRGVGLMFRRIVQCQIIFTSYVSQNRSKILSATSVSRFDSQRSISPWPWVDKCCLHIELMKLTTPRIGGRARWFGAPPSLGGDPSRRHNLRITDR